MPKVAQPHTHANAGEIVLPHEDMLADTPEQAAGAAYRADKTLGLLLVHHHNTDGVRAQVVKVKQPSAARLTLSARTVRAGAAVLAAVSIPASAGPPATGQVTIKYGSAGVVLARGTTTSGYFARNLRLSHGVYVLYADYSGDSNYLAGRSNLVVLQVV